MGLNSKSYTGSENVKKNDPTSKSRMKDCRTGGFKSALEPLMFKSLSPGRTGTTKLSAMSKKAAEERDK